MPTAVLRRYTPPTCTLEIAAAGSALSRWTDRTVLKNLRFQLSFDDPKLPPDEQVAVSGNQGQLETLCDVVGRYVQTLLSAVPEQLPWEESLQSLTPLITNSSSSFEDDSQNHQALPTESEINPHFRTDNLPEASPAAQFISQPASQPISQPVSQPVNQPASQSASQPITPSIAQSIAQSGSDGISLQAQGLLSHRLSLGGLANEESGETVLLSTSQLFDLANALEDYQAEALSLPKLERPAWLAQIPKGWPSIAASALLALGVTGAMTKFVLDVSRPSVQTASAPQERQVNSELSRELFPTLSPPPLEPSPQITLQPLPPPPPPNGTVVPGAAQPGLPPVGVTQPPVNPQPAGAGDGTSGASGSDGGAVVGQADSQAGSEFGQSVTIVPGPTVASAPSAPLAPDGDSAEGSGPPRLATTNAAPEASRMAPAESTDQATAFDTIPQVAEIRSYFQQTWQPPSGLDQTLEYRLLLNADGSLQRIVPLGQFSENYLDRTNMPLMGEPFVSPTSDGSTPQIRLVLKPDGKVQSFLEYAN